MNLKLIIEGEQEVRYVLSLIEKDKLATECKDAFLNSSIDELNMTVRSTNVLKSNNIWTIGELTKISENDFLKMPNGGKKSLYEIRDTLLLHGLSFRPQL